jgi:hypothetical protein
VRALGPLAYRRPGPGAPFSFSPPSLALPTERAGTDRKEPPMMDLITFLLGFIGFLLRDSDG